MTQKNLISQKIEELIVSNIIPGTDTHKKMGMPQQSAKAPTPVLGALSKFQAIPENRIQLFITCG